MSSQTDLYQSPGYITLCCAVPPSPLVCSGGVMVAEGHVLHCFSQEVMCRPSSIMNNPQKMMETVVKPLFFKLGYR